ncbi:MAG: type secretion system protein VasD [Pseudomonadota bacterium]|jgi:type VI secretion system protein VasD
MSFQKLNAFTQHQNERDESTWHKRCGRGAALLARAAVLAAAVCLLQACSSIPTPVEMAGKVLETVGLKKPEPPDLADLKLPPRRVEVRLHASRSLNTDARGQSSGLVVRVYKLTNADAFKLVPFKDFGNVQREKDLMGDALVEARDVQLVPGQQLQWTEKVPRAVSYVGVVALFHTPSSQRWRFLFNAPPLEKTGLSMGAHACTLSVSAGELAGAESDAQAAQFGSPTCR